MTDWRQEEKGMMEDEMVVWHHWHNEHGFGWTPGVGDGQGGLACCSPWGCKESDTTEWLNCTEEEAVTDFIFLGSKITADGDCSHEIKTLAPWKESYDKPSLHAFSGTSVVSGSLWPHGPKPTRLLCPGDSPDKNTVTGCHALLQGIFLTQGLNPYLLSVLHYRQILYCWAPGEAHDKSRQHIKKQRHHFADKGL